MSGLMTHTKKFQQVSVDALHACPVPESTNTFEPINHGWLYEEVRKACNTRGYVIAAEDLRVTDNGDEFFGILRLRQTVNPSNDWDLSLGIRNTNNKRASAGIFLGNNVWLCDNLQFSAEHTFLRKHHAGSYDVVREGVCDITRRLDGYRQEQEQFIRNLQTWVLTPELRDHLIVDCLRNGGILGGEVIKVIGEVESPSEGNPEANGETAWGLMNAITWVQKGGYDRNPETQAQRSIQLQKVFCPA